ncbi:MAG: amidohydrolase [bacterium]
MIPEKNPGSSHADLLITGGIVLPMNGRPPISEGGVAIRGDRILAVGERGEICRTFTADRTLDKPAHLIMPGLVNTHTHAAMSLFRGLADDLPLMEWLNTYIFPAERRIDAGLVHLGTRLACCEMIRTGTTTFKDMYLYEDAVAEATALMGMRAVVGEVLYDFPSPNYGPFEEGLAYTRRMIEKWRGHPLVRVAVEPHSPYLCSPESLREAHRIAEDEQCPLVLHLAETRDEVEQIRQRYGTTPVRHLERLGILGPHVLAVHCVWLDEEEIRLLAEHQVKVAHCPESNMKLAAGIAPVPALLRAGVTVGLGTDGCASNNNLDMFQEMDMAAKLHKVATGDPTVMDAPTVLAMATTEAARALGLADEIGSLEPGKRADIICLDLNQPHLTPLYNIPSQLVYAASGLDVDTVIVNGEILLSDRRFTRCDPQEIMEEVKRWAGTIREEILIPALHAHP